MSCGENTRRHDDAEPGNAERTDLFRVPREVGSVAAARPGRERIVPRLSRCPQQRPTNVAACKSACGPIQKTKVSSDPSAKATVVHRPAVRKRLIFQGAFLLLGVFCGEDSRSNESPAKLSVRVETTRRKLNPANCHEPPLVAIRTRTPTRTPPNGHSTRSLTATGLGADTRRRTESRN